MKFSVQGREVYAYTGGKAFDPKLPTVVFVHGAVNDHSNFNLLARWFAHHGWGVLALDLPGHMRSQGPALHRVESLAGWLLDALNGLGVQRAALVGHSMGSLVALDAAFQAKTRGASLQVQQLVMMGTCVPMPVPQALIDLSTTQLHAAIDRVVMFSFSTLAPKPSFPGPGVWLRGASRRLMRMVCAHAARHHGEPNLFAIDFKACHHYERGLQAAAAVADSCASTLILGALDQMTFPPHAASIAQALKATVHTTQAGHFPMSEAPDPVLNALRLALQGEHHA